MEQGFSDEHESAQNSDHELDSPGLPDVAAEETDPHGSGTASLGFLPSPRESDESAALLEERPFESQRDLADFYVQHRSTMYAVARRIVGDAEEAEDLLQEAVVKFINAAPELESEKHAYHYLLRTIRTAAVDRLRRQGRRPKFEALSDEHHDLVDPENTVDLVLSAENAQIIREALSRLNPAHRAAIVAWHLEGKSIDEVAELIEVEPKNVKHTLARARSAMRKHLEDLGISGVAALGVAVAMLVAVVSIGGRSGVPADVAASKPIVTRSAGAVADPVAPSSSSSRAQHPERTDEAASSGIPVVDSSRPSESPELPSKIDNVEPASTRFALRGSVRAISAATVSGVEVIHAPGQVIADSLRWRFAVATERGPLVLQHSVSYSRDFGLSADVQTFWARDGVFQLADTVQETHRIVSNGPGVTLIVDLVLDDGSEAGPGGAGDSVRQKIRITGVLDPKLDRVMAQTVEIVNI